MGASPPSENMCVRSLGYIVGASPPSENMCVRLLGYNVSASPPQVPILKTVPGPSLHNRSCACLNRKALLDINWLIFSLFFTPLDPLTLDIVNKMVNYKDVTNNT